MKKIMIVWKRFLLWIGAAALLLGAAACGAEKADPGQAMQLDMAQMVETAAGQSPPDAEDEIPETYRCELANEKGDFAVSVDAKVILPEAGALPVARVRQARFTEEDVKRFADVLLGEDAAYVDPGGSGSLVETKAYLARSLWYYQRCIETGTYDDMKYNSVEDMYPIVEKMKKQIETAPEEFARVEPDFSLRPRSGAEEADGEAARLMAAWDNATLSSLDVMNHALLSRIIYHRDRHQYAALSQITHNGAYLNELAWDAGGLLTVSSDTARVLAERTVSELGFTELTCTGERQCVYDGVYDGDRHGVYEFMFTRAVNGAPCTFVDQEQATDIVDGKDGNFVWYYERLRLFVDNGGLLWLEYDHPLALSEMLTENAALLPFSEICCVFEKLVLVSGGDEGERMMELGLRGRLDVSEIRLGLMDLPDRGNDGVALLVPVWDFLGTYTIFREEEADTVVGRDGYHSLFTINAVDGTVVSRERGR